MQVRAKFKVEKVEDQGDNGFSILLRTVYDPDPNSENGRFFKWTPSGEIHMHVVSPLTAAQFVEGEEVFVDFTGAK